MKCKNCGTKKGTQYSFCRACWEKLWTGVDTAKARYEEALGDGPHDASEERLIFDSFVIDLCKVFKDLHRKEKT